MGLFKRKKLEPAQLKFMLRKGLPVIYTTVNGKGAKFLIDTGASSSLIDLTLKNHFKFKVTDIEDIVDVVGIGGKSDMYKTNKIDFRTKVSEMNISFKATNLKLIRGALGVSGVLGGDFLKKYKCNIDYTSKIITIFT